MSSIPFVTYVLLTVVGPAAAGFGLAALLPG
jgi:hypothetical protein